MKIRNHFNEIKSVETNIESSYSSDDFTCILIRINSSINEQEKKQDSTTQWNKEMEIKGKKLKFKLDGGTEANVIPL